MKASQIQINFLIHFQRDAYHSLNESNQNKTNNYSQSTKIAVERMSNQYSFIRKHTEKHCLDVFQCRLNAFQHFFFNTWKKSVVTDYNRNPCILQIPFKFSNSLLETNLSKKCYSIPLDILVWPTYRRQLPFLNWRRWLEPIRILIVCKPFRSPEQKLQDSHRLHHFKWYNGTIIVEKNWLRTNQIGTYHLSTRFLHNMEDYRSRCYQLRA